MRNFLIFISFTFFLCTWNLHLASSQDFHVGQKVVLEAKKAIGVPLHREPAPSYLKHVPSGTPAIIQHITQDEHWLSIQLETEDTHWVHKKYLRASITELPSTTLATSSLSKSSTTSKLTVGGEAQVWSSKDQCEAAVLSGLRMADTSSAKLRVGTWNLRWFPVGSAPNQPQEFAEPTDLDWLICTIRWMQLDILAIQESLGTPEATRAMKTLTSRLSTQTRETWRWHRQSCGQPDHHHIGLLWNDSHVALSKFESLWQFNSKAESSRNPCISGLRPGHYAFAQSRRKDGADFHLIAVHLKSGPTVFALEERQKAFNRIDKVVAPLLKQDRDVVILGDFNTMGAGDRHSQRSELKYLRRFVAKEKPGFTDLAVHPQCSHYFRGYGGQLDHVVVTTEMKEIDLPSAQVTGYCALSDCQRIRGDYPLAYRRLSDHCPVILEIGNRTDD